MHLLSFCPSICFSALSFLLLALFPHYSLAQDGGVALYLDPDCGQISPLTPTVSLALSTCLVPLGAYGIAIKAFPPCNNGTATLIMYKDTSCARSDYNAGSYSGDTEGNDCYWYFSTYTIPGVMFSCENPATDPQATSTTTVTASAIAGVAPPATSSSPTDAGGSTAATTSAGSGDASTATSASGSTSTGTTNAASPTASNKGASSLSTSDKIAIGVGLGVGVPSIVIALLAWCYPR